MSVFVTVRVPVADPSGFEAYAAENADTMKAVAEEGKGRGAIHHHFTAGNGELVVIDLWDTAENFQAFFESNTEIPGLMQGAGATGPPQVDFYPVLDTPDAF